MDMVSDLFVPGVNLIEKIVRPLVIYVFLVVILRLGGRRELAQMNAFDLVVLLTLSNTVQNAIIGEDNSLVGGIVGATALVLANIAVVRFLYQHPKVDRWVEGHPLPLVRKGHVVHKNLQRELITYEELRAVVHRQGVERIEDCEEVTLETSGAITVIAKQPPTDAVSLDSLDERLARIEQALANLQPSR
jgi:uncharacterized membrane protein YcaP (DUF421 family)